MTCMGADSVPAGMDNVNPDTSFMGKDSRAHNLAVFAAGTGE